MKTSQLMAGASRFAHFAGLTRVKGASRRAADDDRREDQAEDDQDEPKGKRSRADDDQEDGGERKGKRSRRAAEDQNDDDKDAVDDQDDEDAPKGKRSRASDDDDDDEAPKSKGKRSRRAAEDQDDDDKDAEDDEDDDDKQEMSGRSSAANARRRERARCAAIFGCRAAASNVALAASLAFDTTMTRREAIAVLKGQADRAPAPQGRRTAREDRNVDLSGSGEPSGGKSKAGSSWDRSFKSVGVLPRG